MSTQGVRAVTPHGLPTVPVGCPAPFGSAFSRCRTEPGISAITAFASVAGLSLSGGFLVTDGPAEARSRIMLKVRHPRQVAEALREEGYRSFVLVERMCMEETRVYRDDELPDESDYMSVLYAER